MCEVALGQVDMVNRAPWWNTSSYQVPTRIAKIGPPAWTFASEWSSGVSRLIVALLAVNFLPAVILWRSEVIGEWLRRHKRKLVISACVLVLLFSLWLGVMFYEKAHRVPPTPPIPVYLR